MRQYRSLAAVSVLALALAACGGPAEEEASSNEAEESAEVEAVDATEDAAGEDADAVEAAVEEADGEEVEEEEEEEVAEAEEVEPTPTPTPTLAVPVGPPASFTQCQVCHSVAPGQSGIGPSLAGISGRAAGAADGFSYTDGMRDANLTWNDATLDSFLADPAGVVPGTTMFIGSIDAPQRAEIIAYLKTL